MFTLYDNAENNFFIGAENFTWWVGQVQADGGKKLNEDGTNSPYKDKNVSNRVKVRIVGYHEPRFEILPVEDLPWAQVMMPPTVPQSSGYGTSHQLALGSWVIGFFMDGLNCQQPIVMGVIGNIDTGVNTKLKPGQILRGDSTKPGFDNPIHPLYDPNDTSGGNSDASQPSGTSDKKTGTRTGTESPKDQEMAYNKEKQVSLASPCGTATQEKIDQTLGDMFRFLKGIKKVNDKYVKKYTGEVVDFVGKIQGFIGRISNIVSDILGSIKTLIIKEITRLTKNLINDILNPIADTLLPAREFADKLLNLIICLVDNILKSILQFIANIILGLIENVVNAAFCLVQGVINSILSAITSAIGGVLDTIKNIVSIIGAGGDLIANLASSLADFIGSICSGFNCEIDASRYDMKTGELQPQSLFGGADAIINTDFLNNINSPQIFDSQGNLVRGTLNCSPENLAFIPCPPKIALLGLNGGAGIPTIIPVVDNLGRIISTIIKNPGFNITSVTSAIATSCNGYGNGAKLKPQIGTGSSDINLPTLEISLNPTTILKGESSRLSWTSTGATNVVVSSNFGAGTTIGSIIVFPKTTRVYTIKFTTPQGIIEQQAILNVLQRKQDQPNVAPPTLKLNLSPINIIKGKSSTLSWSSTGSTSIIFSNFGAGSTIGSVVVNPQSTTTYEMEVSGLGGKIKQTITLNVIPEPSKVRDSIVDIIIENPGRGYSYFNGSPDNINEDEVIAADSPNIYCVIVGFDVTNVGSGYDENTKIIVNGVECGIPTILNGSITSVTSTCSGTKVTGYPDIQVIGNGSGAKIIPIIKCVPINEAETLTYKYNIPIEKIDCPGDVING